MRRYAAANLSNPAASPGDDGAPPLTPGTQDERTLKEIESRAFALDRRKAAGCAVRSCGVVV
ncbi:hypothetical protein Pa4123_21460 [Phytohabitans aurantiacus]|uniref:Uncharacterized protein n=1 Tax=Phytohabitans aurantiacus TaxID=3016789 RepID=A0ABQ5QRJ1_9ACTN|nr:hypothetical protein Pa4123_21460 [Phytohabitans aurantiacus]